MHLRAHSTRAAAAAAARPGTASAAAAASAPAADPVQRARKRMGYKSNWHRGNVESRQVAWPQPLSGQQAVAIIGGGIAGLSCAQGLVRHGMPAVVFDTGEHGVGGRAATRTTADRSIRPDWLAAAVSDGGVGGSAGASSSLRDAGLLFDHAAQCFTATAPAFKQQCEEWEAAGVVRRWAPHAVGVLAPGGRFSPLSPASPVYVAAGGMRALAEHMSRCVAGSSGGSTRVVAPMWVSKMAASQAAGGWRLTGAGRDQGTFGAVVVAHNGKCANRLVGPVGAPAVARQLMTLRLSAVWVLMVAFEGPVSVPQGMQGAFVAGSPVLSWVGNNTSKLALQHGEQHAGMQCWTLISTNGYGQANKVPQERVPADVAAKVTADMLAAFGALLAPAASPRLLPKAVFTKVQLWGAALPLNSPQVPCILDPVARVGVCGDWLLGASIQSAWLSGQALADRLAALRGADAAAAQALATGLQDRFVPVQAASGSAAAEIGEFPGCAGLPAGVAAPRKQQQQQQQPGGQQRNPQQQQQPQQGRPAGPQASRPPHKQQQTQRATVK